MTQVYKEHYCRKKYDDLDRFISYFYQVDLTQQVAQRDANMRMHANDTNEPRILEVGKGNGFFSNYMKKNGHSVTTADFDGSLNPDIVADIRSLPISDKSFDIVTAFEVL